MHIHNTYTIPTIAIKTSFFEMRAKCARTCWRDHSDACSTVGEFDRHLKFKWVFKSQTGIALLQRLQRNWIQSEQ